MRRPLVAGNWKMNKRVGEAVELAGAVESGISGIDDVEVLVCPTYTALGAVARALENGRTRLGAQNVHWEPAGAFTGEISASMLADLGCEYVIIGHSERRTYFQETDQSVLRKTRAALEGGLKPIVCVGETLEERDAGVAERVVRTQVSNGLGGLGDGLARAVIAYEPVWAIGTGRTASPAEVQEAHRYIRSRMARLAGEQIAEEMRILYGGSVKPDNAAELFACPDVDGGLIGGAALDAGPFIDIVRAASS